MKWKKGLCVHVYQEGSKPLTKNQLPLWKDVDSALEYAKEIESKSNTEAIKKVSSDISEIYQKASIVTIDPIKITQSFQGAGAKE